MGRKAIEFDNNNVVQLLAKGYTVPEISTEFGINVRTLEAKLVRLRDKSSSANNTNLVYNYMKKGLIK